MALDSDYLKYRKTLDAGARSAGKGVQHLQIDHSIQALSLHIKYRALADLKPNRRNARLHSKKQIQQVAASIAEFGFVSPILTTPDGHILAGHARYEAAKLLDIEKVPAVVLAHLNEAQKRAYVIADNQLAQLAGWDEELLALELKELSDPALNFPFEVIGFDTVEIDQFVARLEAGVDKNADLIPPPETTLPAATSLGDKWKLGDHEIICGDATKRCAYEALLSGELADMVFTDPPYNVAIDGHASGLGRNRHREFAMASGEMSEQEFTVFLTSFMRNTATHSKEGSIHFVCMDWRHMDEALAAGRVVFGRPKNLIVWVKTNGGMGAFYRSQHELVFVFKKGKVGHTNNFGLGEKGRYRTNVWPYAGVNTFKRGRNEELASHPTVKPVAMIVDAIRDCSNRNEIVLDAFGGSGTTLIACEKAGRRARLIEIDPLYVDVTIRRWQALTGKHAVHAQSGLCFAQLEAEQKKLHGVRRGPRPRKRTMPEGSTT